MERIVWYKQKSTWTGIIGILQTAAQIAAGTMTYPAAIPVVALGIFSILGIQEHKENAES